MEGAVIGLWPAMLVPCSTIVSRVAHASPPTEVGRPGVRKRLVRYDRPDRDEFEKPVAGAGAVAMNVVLP